MAITLDLYELKNLCMEMAELGAAQYVKKVFPSQDKMSQRQAYAMFGEAKVKSWVLAGIVKPTRSGSAQNSKRIYSKAALMGAQKMEKLNLNFNIQ